MSSSDNQLLTVIVVNSMQFELFKFASDVITMLLIRLLLLDFKFHNNACHVINTF